MITQLAVQRQAPSISFTADFPAADNMAEDLISNSPFQPSSSIACASSSSSSSPCTSPVGSSGSKDDGMVHTEVGLLYPMASPVLLAQRVLRAYGPMHAYGHAPPRRQKRQMTPATEKDAAYREKRQKNNTAARRSREKRRLHDHVMKEELLALSNENTQLRAELLSLQYRLGLARGPTKASVPLGPLSLQRSLQAPYLYPASALFSAGGLWGHGARDSSFLPLQGTKGHGEIAGYHRGPGWPALAPPGDGLASRDPAAEAVLAAGAPQWRPKSGYKSQEVLQCVRLAGTLTAPQRSNTPPQLQLPSSGERHPAPSPPASSSYSNSSTSTMTRPAPESCLLTQLHHPVAWQNKQPMMPCWGSAGPYLSLPPSTMYPGMPLYMAME